MAKEWSNIGRVSPCPKGVWSSSTAYQRLDIVTNADKTKGYIAKKDVPAGTALTNATYWLPILDVSSVVSAVREATMEANSIVDGKANALAATAAGNPVDVYPDAGSILKPVLTFGPAMAGSGDPSPDNPRAIGKYTKAHVSVSGRNIANTVFVHGTRGTNGVLSSTTGNIVAYEDLVPVAPGTKIYASSEQGAFINTRYYFYDSSRALVYTAVGDPTAGLTVPGNACWFALQKSEYDGYADYVGKAVMVDTEPITEFVPYNGSVATVDLGRDVYGGTLDWNAGTLTVDKALFTVTVDSVSGHNAVSGGTADIVVWITGNYQNAMLKGDSMDGWCSHFINGGTKNINTVRFGADTQTIYFYVSSERFADADAFRAFVSEQEANGTPLQVVYPLANPVTVQLDTEQLLAFPGMNRVCASANGMVTGYNKDLTKAFEDMETTGGSAGEDGGYYAPSVASDGTLAWTASKSGMPTVASVNIKGPQGEKGASGAKGDKGDPGDDYVLTAADKAEIAGMVGGSVVPDYWASELETKANDIQVAMETAGRNKSAFLWYTDAHWPSSAKVSPILLDYLVHNTPMNKVNFGGDIVGDPDPYNHDNVKYVYDWRERIAGLPNHHSVYGNHDVNHWTTDVHKIAYAMLIAPEESSDMVIGGDSYYYIDNPSEKTRYLYLSYLTSDQTAMLEQGKFIAEALTETPEGWHIVAIAHRWWQYGETETPTVGSVPGFEKDILSVFDAYNARTTREASNYFYTQDFTDAKGKVEFCIGGHIHVDHDFTSDGGIPVIITASDTNQERVPTESEDSGTVGTITEAAVFGIIADYTDAENTKITVVGVGRGTSRVVGMGGTDVPDEPASTNLFNKDDPDIVDTGRFNSSNNAVAFAEGQLVTGYVEGAVGDTFTITTDKANNTNTYTGTIMCYNSAKGVINRISWQFTTNGDVTASDDYKTVSIHIPESYDANTSYVGTAYVRFCVAYTDIDSIVITKA